MPVTVYAAPGCQPCEATKKYLDRRAIPYEVAPASSERAQAIAAEHGFTAAPIVEAGGQCWSGFRPDMLDRIKI